MKSKILILLSFLCSISAFASCKGAKESISNYKVRPDSAVCDILRKEVSDNLFSPSKVTCYTLRGVDTVKKGSVEVEPHYVRDSFITRLNFCQIDILQFNLLSSKDNYRQDLIKVRSPYYPCIEFCFEKKKAKPVHILVSLSDYTWTIMFDGGKVGNWNYADKDLMERYCKMILGDTYLKIR